MKLSKLVVLLIFCLGISAASAPLLSFVIASPESIQTLALSSSTYTGVAAPGTVIGTVTAAMNPPGPPFSGGLSIPIRRPDPTIGLLTGDRDAYANWVMAGLQSVGGIPNRTTQCGATLTPSGGDDYSQLQAAINACSSGDFVQLGNGTFQIADTESILINKSISLRGNGAGNTILQKPTDYPPGSGTTIPCPPHPGSAANFGCYQGAGSGDLVRISPFAENTSNTYTACALTADTHFGDTRLSVTSSCAAHFHVGDIVLLDEDAGVQWMPDTESGTGSNASAVCANDDYRVVYNITINPSNVVSGDSNACPGSGAVVGAYTLNSNRLTNELKRVSTVSRATITFDSPIMQNYRVSHRADLWYFETPFLQQAGVENMSLRYSSNPVQFWFCQYCWVTGTNVAYGFGDLIAVWASFRTQVDTNYVHECAWPEPGEACYQLEQKYDSSETYFVNNISVLANKVIAMQASGAGSVVAYNYLDKGYIEGDCCWQEMGANASHLTGPHHILFEGNWAFNMDSDDTHGGSNFITFFRNWSTATRGLFQGMTQGQGATTISFTTWNDVANQCGNLAYSGSPLRATGPAAHSYWFSFIGNVLGTPGCTTAATNFPLNNTYGGSFNSDGIFLIGWYNGGASVNDAIAATIYPTSPPTISCAAGITCAVPSASCSTYGSNCSTILYNNYDYVRAGNCDDNSPTCTTPTHALPNSFYLASAPAFFTTGFNWPWIDPSNGGLLTTSSYDNLPAKARYDAGSCATAVFQNGTDCEPFANPPPPSITRVALNGGTTPSYATGAPSGTIVGPISVSMTFGSFDGSLSLSGTAAADFSISGSNLVTNSSTPTCSGATNYSLNIVAAPGANESGSSYTRSVTVTCNHQATAWNPAHTNSNVGLTNSNYTATDNASSSGDVTAFSTTSKTTTSEKLYFEGSCVVSAGGHGPGLGIANSTEFSASYIGIDNNGAAYDPTTGSGSQLWYNNGPRGSWAGCVNGDTVGITINTTVNPATASVHTNHGDTWGSTFTYNLPTQLSNGIPLYIALDLFSPGDATTLCTASACGVDGGAGLPSGAVWWDHG